MVEAVGQNFGDLGLSGDGMTFSNEKEPEQGSAMEKGRKFLDDQLSELKSSGDFDKWVGIFKAKTLSLATNATVKWVDISETLSKTPIGANIDDIGDVLGIALIFCALPAWNEAVKLGKQIISPKREAA